MHMKRDGQITKAVVSLATILGMKALPIIGVGEQDGLIITVDISNHRITEQIK